MKKHMKCSDNTKISNDYNGWDGPLAGACAGAAAAAASYPFAAIKKMLQSNQPISLKTFVPSTLYRGVIQYTVFNFPATMIQIGLGRQLLHISGDNSTSSQIKAGLTAGFFSGFLLAPVESMMLNQQQQKCGPVDAWRYIIKTNGTYGFLKGGLATAMRESIYALTILWGAEAVGEKLTDIFQYNMRFFGIFLVSVLSAPLSHPFDAIATHQQCSSNNSSFLNSTKSIFKEQGIRGFYKGFLPRLGIFAVGIPVAVQTKNFVLNKLEKNKR